MRIRVYMEKGGNPHLFHDDVVAAFGELRSILPSLESVEWEIVEHEGGTITADTSLTPDNPAGIGRELAEVIEENTGERVKIEVLGDWP